MEKTEFQADQARIKELIQQNEAFLGVELIRARRVEESLIVHVQVLTQQVMQLQEKVKK